jgi:hypothetical protein
MRKKNNRKDGPIRGCHHIVLRTPLLMKKRKCLFFKHFVTSAYVYADSRRAAYRKLAELSTLDARERTAIYRRCQRYKLFPYSYKPTNKESMVIK